MSEWLVVVSLLGLSTLWAIQAFPNLWAATRGRWSRGFRVLSLLMALSASWLAGVVSAGMGAGEAVVASSVALGFVIGIDAASSKNGGASLIRTLVNPLAWYRGGQMMAGRIRHRG